MAYIELRDVSKYYHMGNTVIKANDKMSFKIEKGEFCVIVGSSGAGKSTVLNILGGMDSADEGSVMVDGTDVAQFDEKERTKYRREDVGFVFQNYNLVANLTAKENVELASQIVKRAKDPEEALREVGLGERINNFPAQLSGGEQQRVAIARAIAKEPKLLLCDEPTGALDYQTGKMILKLLEKTCETTGTTVVVITHNHAITPMADRVIHISDGHVSAMEIQKEKISINEIEW